MAKETEKTKGTDVTVSRGGEVERTTPGRKMSPFEEMERMFEEFFPRRWLQSLRREWPAWGEMGFPDVNIPSVDVIDRDNDVVVRAELPGVDKKDLDVSATDTTVTIKGSTTREEKEERENYYRREMSRGAFARTVPLPVSVEGEKARASFNNGILEVVIPKAETSKRRRISVE